MAIKVGEKDLFPYLGDYGPVSIYKGEQKLAGYKWAEKSGQELHFDNTYNSHVEVEVDGKSYQHGTPTPDYPSEIHSLNDFDVVSSVGRRNLLKNSNFRDGGEHWDTLNNPLYEIKDNVVLSGGEATYVKLRQDLGQSIVPGDVYYARAEVRALSDFYKLQFQLGPIHNFRNSFGQTTPTKDEWVILSGIVEAGSFDEYIFAITSDNRSNYDSPLWETKREVQLINLTATFGRGNEPSVEEADELFKDWTPAPEDITENDNHPLIDKINFSLSEPLRSVGDVKDRLFRDDSDGLWKIERNVGEAIFDGSETISLETRRPEIDMVQMFSFKIRPTVSRRDNDRGLSSHFVITTPFTKEEGSTSASPDIGERINLHNISGAVRFRVNTRKRFGKSAAYTVSSDLNNWLRNNPVTVIYELATPTIETLSQELQDQFNTLKSFKDSNYVYSVLPDDDLTPTIRAKTEVKDI